LGHKFDLFAISESWLNPTHADAEVCIPDYQLHRHDREFSHKRGGTAIYVKNTIICNRVYPLHNTVSISIDYVCLEIRQHQSGQRMLFIVIYRPPNSHAELYSHVQQLKSDLKNLEASIERRITQSNVHHGIVQLDQTTKPKKALSSLVTATTIYQTFGKQQK
jgi:hypothetical protein